MTIQNTINGVIGITMVIAMLLAGCTETNELPTNDPVQLDDIKGKWELNTYKIHKYLEDKDKETTIDTNTIDEILYIRTEEQMKTDSLFSPSDGSFTGMDTSYIQVDTFTFYENQTQLDTNAPEGTAPPSMNLAAGHWSTSRNNTTDSDIEDGLSLTIYNPKKKHSRSMTHILSIREYSDDELTLEYSWGEDKKDYRVTKTYKAIN